MNVLLEDHKDLVKLLIDAKVDFIVVGGYAVIFHGYVRTTGDLDLWLRPDNENKQRLIPVFEHLGILKEDIDQINNTDFTQTIAFHIDEPPRRVDFFTKEVGLKFEEAKRRAAAIKIENYLVPVLHLEDLIVNKLISGRTKDKADVEELQKIMRYGKKDNP